VRKVIYSILSSLDGFIAGPNGELDWVIIDEELHRYINDQESAIGAHLYGRRTYETMEAYWPTADKDPSNPLYIIEFARIWQRMPKIVFSRTLQKVGENARLVKENIAGEINALKVQSSKDMEVGGAGIAATFMQLGLIDEYQLYVQPVILGNGIPLFQTPGVAVKLRLVEVHPFHSGVVQLRYHVDQKQT